MKEIYDTNQSTARSLPKLTMTEAIITREWKHYLDKNNPKSTETYELKLVDASKQRSFAFDRVADHQIVGLLASLEGLWIKIPDQAAINGQSSPKPFDVVYIKSSGAYVLPIFYFPRKYKFAIKIPITVFVGLKATWPRKSIRMEELASIDGVETIYL